MRDGSKTIFSCILPHIHAAASFYLEITNDHPNEAAAFHWASYTGANNVHEWNEYFGNTTKVRDWGSWYHIVLSISGTTTLIYLNGELYSTTTFHSNYYPQSNSQFQIGCNAGEQLGNGYFADTYWIDGQALAPTAFGEVHEEPCE